MQHQVVMGFKIIKLHDMKGCVHLAISTPVPIKTLVATIIL